MSDERGSCYNKKIEEVPQDPIYGLYELYRKSQRTDKLQLAIGVIPDPQNHSQPLLMDSVHRAYQTVLQKGPPNFQYSSLKGNQAVQNSFVSILDLHTLNDVGVASIQSVGGTGALTTLGIFCYNHGIQNIAYGTPTWSNHQKIFSNIGFQIHEWNWRTKSGEIDRNSFCKTLETIPPETAITFLFQLSCHNPTGVDPSLNDWDFFFETIQKRFIKPPSILFDIAYLGLKNVPLEEEVRPLQRAHFWNLPIFIALSLAKSAGLYSERVGMAFAIGEKKDIKAIESHFCSIQRAMYSSPPKFGALIAEELFCHNKELYQEWKNDCQMIAKRLQNIRVKIATELEKKIEASYASLKNGSGLFYQFESLTEDDIRYLREEEAIFMTEDGRINVACLDNESYMDRFIATITRRLSH